MTPLRKKTHGPDEQPDLLPLMPLGKHLTSNGHHPKRASHHIMAHDHDFVKLAGAAVFSWYVLTHILKHPLRLCRLYQHDTTTAWGHLSFTNSFQSVELPVVSTGFFQVISDHEQKKELHNIESGDGGMVVQCGGTYSVSWHFSSSRPLPESNITVFINDTPSSCTMYVQSGTQSSVSNSHLIFPKAGDTVSLRIQLLSESPVAVPIQGWCLSLHYVPTSKNCTKSTYCFVTD